MRAGHAVRPHAGTPPGTMRARGPRADMKPPPCPHREAVAAARSARPCHGQQPRRRANRCHPAASRRPRRRATPDATAPSRPRNPYYPTRSSDRSCQATAEPARAPTPVAATPAASPRHSAPPAPAERAPSPRQVQVAQQRPQPAGQRPPRHPPPLAALRHHERRRVPATAAMPAQSAPTERQGTDEQPARATQPTPRPARARAPNTPDTPPPAAQPAYPGQSAPAPVRDRADNSAAAQELAGSPASTPETARPHQASTRPAERPAPTANGSRAPSRAADPPPPTAHTPLNQQHAITRRIRSQRAIAPHALAAAPHPDQPPSGDVPFPVITHRKQRSAKPTRSCRPSQRPSPHSARSFNPRSACQHGRHKRGHADVGMSPCCAAGDEHASWTGSPVSGAGRRNPTVKQIPSRPPLDDDQQPAHARIAPKRTGVRRQATVRATSADTSWPGRAYGLRHALRQRDRDPSAAQSDHVRGEPAARCPTKAAARRLDVSLAQILFAHHPGDAAVRRARRDS